MIDSMVFTVPATWHDGTTHNEVRGYCYVNNTDSDYYGGPHVAFQDDINLYVGHPCVVPMDKVPELIEWLQAMLEARQ